MSGDVVRPMTAEELAKRGWRLAVNGQVVENVASASLLNARMGVEIRYGMRAEGYDGPVICETGGGGSVIIPFTEWKDRLYIGVVEQKRVLQDGVVLNVPRGFLRPGENHFQAAKRETLEETAYAAADLKVVELSGAGVNPNSAFFDTSGPGTGVKFYALAVPPRHINWSPPDGKWATFADGALRVDSASSAAKVAEGILKCRFLPWFDAAELGDLFTLGAIARLQKYRFFQET